MPDGFFADSTLASKKPLPLIARCGSCGLHKTCDSPKMPVAGQGRKKILILAEAPGKKEDARGIPFVGPAGQYLWGVLDGLGVNLFKDCWITNSLICHPWELGKNGQKKNRPPTTDEIGYCRPNVIKAITELQPELIVPLGSVAVHSLLGWLWKEDVGSISRWLGWSIPCQRLNAWICPAHHPSYCLHKESALVDLLFKNDLQKALSNQGRPWDKVPDYKSQVQIIAVASQAARVIKEIVAMGLPVAIDYETDGLKPDRKERTILCCAVSNGALTLAYPWLEPAIQATKDLLTSNVPKIAANMKFEYRWTLAKLGVHVNNFVFDTMVAAHVLDNRQGIASLKFQAFVRLGQESYDDHIKTYLKAPGTNEKNRAKEIDPRQLLEYCGMDALLELELARIQAKDLGLALTGSKESDIQYAQKGVRNAYTK